MDNTSNKIPRTLPVLHMSNVVMFPYLLMPLVVSDEESKLVIDYALANDKLMAFFLDMEKEDGEVTELVKIWNGCNYFKNAAQSGWFNQYAAAGFNTHQAAENCAENPVHYGRCGSNSRAI